MKARHEHNSTKRDEKIRMIKINHAREAQIEQDRELKRIKKEEEEAAKRLAELEHKRNEEIRKREHEYKQKRDAVLKFTFEKEVHETLACKEYLRVLESKIDRSEQKQRMLLSEKVGRIQEHNHDVLEKT